MRSKQLEAEIQDLLDERRGDVLVTEGSGSLGTVGASAVWRAELAGTVCFQNTMLRLRPPSAETERRRINTRRFGPQAGET